MERSPVKPLAVEVIDPLEVSLEAGGVLRFLGYPVEGEPRPEVREEVERVLDELPGRLRPRGIYALYPVVSQTDRELHLGSGDTFTGEIGGFLRGARRVAVFVATAGPEMMEWIDSAWTSGRVLKGMVLDALGSLVADAAVESIRERLKGRLAPGEALTPAYSPGYCGMGMEQQRVIFRLVEASVVGVELMPSLLMRPLKSVSGLVGLGPEREIPLWQSPCERCPLEGCRMRRSARGIGRGGAPGPARLF